MLPDVNREHELVKLSPPGAALSAPGLEKSTLRRGQLHWQ